MQRVSARSGKRTVCGIDIDPSVDRDHLGLRQVLVLLVTALVVRPGFTRRAWRSGIRSGRARCSSTKPRYQWHEARRQPAPAGGAESARGETAAGGPTRRLNRGASGRWKCTPRTAEIASQYNRPKQRGNEVSVTVHVAVGVRRRIAEQIKRVLPAKIEQNGDHGQDADDDAVTDELIANDSLNEKRKQGEDDDLRKR